MLLVFFVNLTVLAGLVAYIFYCLTAVFVLLWLCPNKMMMMMMMMMKATMYILLSKYNCLLINALTNDKCRLFDHLYSSQRESWLNSRIKHNKQQ